MAFKGKGYLLIILASICLVTVGCTNASKELVVPEPELTFVPIISNLIVIPGRVSIGLNGGKVNVKGWVDFLDKDGDVETLYLQEAGKEPVPFPISNLEELKSGVIVISLFMDTTEAKVTNFNVWIVDSEGQASNELAGIFIVD